MRTNSQVLKKISRNQVLIKARTENNIFKNIFLARMVLTKKLPQVHKCSTTLKTGKEKAKYLETMWVYKK